MTSQHETPLVSTIALCYNQAKFAVETLDSIKNQTYQNIELIIMDDCSSDDSVDVIENWINENQYPCFFIKHEKNQGICKTLNEAFSHCKGEYLQMIACDDIMLPEKTALQVDLMNEQPDDVAVIYSDAYLIKEDGSPHYGWFIQRYKQFSDVPSGNIYEELLKGNFIPAMSVLIRTKVIEEIGGWDEDLSYEDHDCWLRVAQLYEFTFMPKPIVKYRLHSANLSKSIQWNDSYFKIYHKNIANPVTKINIYNKFFDLYKNGQENDLQRSIYCNVFYEKLSTKFIKAKLPYCIYRLLHDVKLLFNKKD